LAPLLSIIDLVKEYPIKGSKSVVHAVTGVSLEIERGETLALVGESGSGKTTTGRCVLRLTEPTSGSIIYQGKDISRTSSREFRKLRRKLQLVSQNPLDSLDPRQRLGDVIAEPLKVGWHAPESQLEHRVGELLRLVNLPAEVAARYPHEVGGGVQQRVAIARSFANQPDLVVLDEPTSALDPLARADVLELLTKLQGDSAVSFLFISHDLNTVKRISSRIAVMYLGRIVELGATNTVFANPQHPYTRALLNSMLVADPSASRQSFTLRGEIPSAVKLPPGCALASRCPLATVECTKIIPPLELVGEGHTAACIKLPRWAAPDGHHDRTPGLGSDVDIASIR